MASMVPNLYGTPQVAQPGGMNQGADRLPGGATPLGVAAGLVTGLGTPITNQMDPALEAELRQKYIRLLSEITAEEVRLQNETVETWGSLQSSLLSARANLLSSVAEGAKAKAMSDQAVADAMGIYDGMADMATELIYFQPDQESWDAWKANSDMLNTSVISATAESTGYGSGVTASTSSGEALAKYTDTLNNTQVNAQRLVTVMVEHSNALSDDPTQRTVTVMQEYGKMEADIRQAYATMASRDGYSVSEDELEAWTQHYMTTYVAPTVFGTETSQGLITESDLSIHNQRQMQAMEHIEMLNQRMDKMGSGLPSELVMETRIALNNAEQMVAGGPLAFSDMVMQMPTPEGTTLAKQMILNELARLDQGTVDPLNLAKAEILAIPGFDVWMQAMGFNSVTRAMLYAGNHPYEFKEATKAFVASQGGALPEAVGTPQGMRAYLKQKGDEEGFGFQVTPLGRAVALFTGRRNLGFDLTDRLAGIRAKLESYEPRTEAGAGLRDRVVGALGGEDVPTGPGAYPEGQDLEGVEGEHNVDMIEADVKLHEDLAAARGGAGAPAAAAGAPAGEQDPGFREIDGRGGYRYRQYADGRIEIIANPKGPLAKPIKVDPGSTYYGPISNEIGEYPTPAAAPAAPATTTAPAAAPLKDEGPTMEEEAERAFVEEAQKALQVQHPPGKAEADYTVVKLAEEDGGWTLRIYNDGLIQVADAPGFEDQVGKTFQRGTYQHQELMGATRNAQTMVPVQVKKPEPAGTEDIQFQEPAAGDVKVEQGGSAQAAAAPAAGGKQTLYWKDPSGRSRAVEVDSGSEDEAWWRSQGALAEGETEKPKPQAQTAQASAQTQRKPLTDPAQVLASGYPGGKFNGQTPTG